MFCLQARGVTEALSPDKRRTSPYGRWQGGHHSGNSNGNSYARTPPMRNMELRSYDFNSPQRTPGPRHVREVVDSPVESTPSTMASTPGSMSAAPTPNDTRRSRSRASTYDDEDSDFD